METRSQKPNLTNYNLLIAQYLRQGYNLLSSQVTKLAGEIHKINCKYRHDNEKAKRVELNTKTVSAISNAQSLDMIK